MLQLLAIAFFFALLVALTVVLEETIRGSWREMTDALMGRPMARRHARPVAAIVTVPRSRRTQRAAA